MCVVVVAYWSATPLRLRPIRSHADVPFRMGGRRAQNFRCAGRRFGLFHCGSPARAYSAWLLYGRIPAPRAAALESVLGFFVCRLSAVFESQGRGPEYGLGDG